MTIVDRYLTFQFLRTFLICFLSFTGLYIVIHLSTNSDEMAAIAKTDTWPTLFYEFYVPRIAAIFDKSAGILILASAIFSVSMLQRSREMTAIEASGITKARILRPIFVASLAIVGLTIANREIWIPKVADRLVRDSQSWKDDTQVDLMVQEDLSSGVVLRGDQLFIGERRISDAALQLPRGLAGGLDQISSVWAIVEPENKVHPAGLWFHQVKYPADLSLTPTVMNADNEKLVFTPRDHEWLNPDECFVVCDFNVQEMAYGTALADFQSTTQMVAELRKPREWFGSKLRVGVHSRMLQPLLDMTLLMLGLPMIIGGIERNVFVSFGICFWIVGAVQLTTIVCHALGTSNIIQPAAMAAWMPLAIFFPFAVVAMRKLKN